MDKKMLKDIDAVVKKGRYCTRTEFVRDSIRRRLTDAEKEEARRKIRANLGFLKGKTKNISDEEASRLASIEMAKKFGITLD